MYVHIPAIKGRMGSREYYTCVMPLSAVPSLFKFTDWSGIDPEDREQRVLTERRVPAIRDYMLTNEDGYLFSSIVASYRGSPMFETLDGSNDITLGRLRLKLGDELIINDGQHRAAGIASALKQNPALGEHTISVLLFPYENRERTQQMFSDLNRFVKKTSKSLDILYDHRDPVTAATLHAVDTMPIFRDLTDKDSIALKSGSGKLFTLAALYDANKDLLKGRTGTLQEQTAFIQDFWGEVARNMPDWEAVRMGRKSAGELRQEKLSAHSTILRGLGNLGRELTKQDDWRDRLGGLNQIDWTRQNKEWDRVCVVANSVVSNRQAREATALHLKRKLGLGDAPEPHESYGNDDDTPTPPTATPKKRVGRPRLVAEG